jgi:hypothetical protein
MELEGPWEDTDDVLESDRTKAEIVPAAHYDTR